MITETILKELGFANIICPYSGKLIWINNDILCEFDFNTQRIRFQNSEFCMFSKICKEEMQLKEFIKCIKFLFYYDN